MSGLWLGVIGLNNVTYLKKKQQPLFNVCFMVSNKVVGLAHVRR